MKILVVMAMPEESQGLLEKAGFEVLYTGIGKIKATLQLTKYLSSQMTKNEFDLILNLGTAGSFNLSPGQVVEAIHFVQRDVDLSVAGLPAGKFPKQINEYRTQRRRADLNSGICGTGDAVITEPGKVQCDLLDMEAFALAEVAAHFGVAFSSFKFVTDRSDQNTYQDWKNSLQMAAQALAAIAIQLRDSN